MRLNWKNLFSYGEVACFVTAWVAGVAIALSVVSTSSISEEHYAVSADTINVEHVDDLLAGQRS